MGRTWTKLPDLRHAFEVDDEVAYFNTAAMSPMLHEVREAGERALARRSRPWTISDADWFGDGEALRAEVGRLLGSDAEHVALVPATSYGLASLARNLTARPGDRVVVPAREYPSNHHTWRRFARRTGAELVVAEPEPGEGWTSAIVRAIGDRAAVVSVPNVHWTNAELIDLAGVEKAARAAGAAFVIDASQSLGAMPLDVSALRPDAVVAVGYKWLLGPFSLAFLYLDARHHHGEPLEENWISRAGSDDFATLMEYRDEYLPGARRFDMGQRSSLHLVPMALAAVRRLREWTVPRVAATLAGRTAEIASRLAALGLPTLPAAARGPHFLGVDLPPGSAPRVATALASAGVITAARGSVLRVSPHLHTSTSDVDRLITTLSTTL
ncbi:aminotransferase class V-fold PLP-dependent enzyme [Bailinhaonella thermotolerans]|uniref:Aminotransferase class V-fold PLP-dependent enzyme n=1 Tax=Bailinhaonella thermotolerans TaxID=1070861 RepID=A0A3A4AFI6_9ACTN|nr:aminotransferase class V-fold PLP-dependent enzyme [Bailinhaonella thermotolerans]RJL24770.1 aminotransferase class V-fold PLP-dependent enzyme [Bailinhaonella thermotolerans]